MFALQAAQLALIMTAVQTAVNVGLLVMAAIRVDLLLARVVLLQMECVLLTVQLAVIVIAAQTQASVGQVQDAIHAQPQQLLLYRAPMSASQDQANAPRHLNTGHAGMLMQIRVLNGTLYKHALQDRLVQVESVQAALQQPLLQPLRIRRQPQLDRLQQQSAVESA